MKIGLVRHFPVKKEFLKGRVKQSEVIQWFHEYDAAPVQSIEFLNKKEWKKCYCSQLPRATETARAIYTGEINTLEALNEPFPSPIFKADVKLPFLLWALIVRLAILHNHSSQVHRKEILQVRLQAFLNQIINENDDALVVSHALTMEIMSARLLKEGFEGERISRPEHGRLYVFEKITDIATN